MVIIILCFVIYFYVIQENNFEYFSIFQKEGGMMQACWQTQDSLMTFKLLLTLLNLGNPYCIYGDPAYPLRVHLQAPFRNRALTPQMMDFNQSMSSVRESVEWLFNDVTNYFKFLDLKKT